MHFGDLALVIFTVLAQASVGAFILIAWLRLRNKDEAMEAVYRKSVIVLLPLMAIGLLASMLHLGRPLLAMTAMKHLATSWLSREIFFTGGFFVLLAASVALAKNVAVRRVVDALAALAGVLSVVSMSMVYEMTMRPAWQGFGTHVAFVGTAVVVGLGLAAGLILLFGRDHVAVASNLSVLVGGSLIGLVVVAVAYPVYLATLAGGGMAAQESLAMLGGEYSLMLALRWVLTLAGGLLPLVFAWRRLAAGKAVSALVYSAVLFLMAGELVGRYLFYVTGVSIGIG
ncbi:MAG: dmsC2 [Symbiobacteriaceae bacterium]|nr:dmsC2 [Symbiobacteriaceae bacterium]